MLAAIALGIGAGLALGSGSSVEPSPPPVQAASAAPSPASIDAEVLAQVQTLRDEAEALTISQVNLDERAHELWMPRIAMIEAAREDPDTPLALRRELDATIVALECVGVLASSSPGTCATIER